jgi:transposase-like protein
MKKQKVAQKTISSYSVAFKMRVVEEVENGLISTADARRLYGIGGRETIQEWVKRYGLNERINKVVYTMTRDEEIELIRLRKENKRLIKALDDSQLKSLALESLIEVAEEKYNLGLKKNFGSKVLEELKKKLMPCSSEEDSE